MRISTRPRVSLDTDAIQSQRATRRTQKASNSVTATKKSTEAPVLATTREVVTLQQIGAPRKCTGWTGERERKVIQVSIDDDLRKQSQAGTPGDTSLPARFPLSEIFADISGYTELSIRCITPKNEMASGVSFVLYHVDCDGTIELEKQQGHLCSKCADCVIKVARLFQV